MDSVSRQYVSLYRLHKLCQAGHAEIIAENYDNARELFIEALDFRREYHDRELIDYALLSLGSTYLFTDRNLEGIQFFSQYIENFPKDYSAYRERAELFWYIGELESAVADLSVFLRENPKDIVSLSSRGQILAELGSYEEGYKDLGDALLELSAVYRQNREWYEWYRQIEAYVHNGLGLALAGFGKTKAAFAEWELSVRLSGENAWVYHNRATVLEKMGELDRARLDYETALRKRQPPLSKYRLAQVKERLANLPGQL